MAPFPSMPFFVDRSSLLDWRRRSSQVKASPETALARSKGVAVESYGMAADGAAFFRLAPDVGFRTQSGRIREGSKKSAISEEPSFE